MEPLAYILRPKTFDEIVGQEHLVGKNGVIRKLALSGKIPSIILYGKPGIGKTTIATVICNESKIKYEFFNASSDNKAKLVSIIEKAKAEEKFILIVDEIHRMKKDIQDYLLPFCENGAVIMIGITTVNPYMSVNPAIRSRSMVYALKDLNNDDLEKIVNRTLNYLNENIIIDDDAKKYIISMASGEVRLLINSLESINNILTDNHITLDIAKNVLQKASVGIDKNEDTYYHALSGLQKSIRGSDVDASLHYLAVLLTSEDLISITRRLQVIAYEDCGLANPAMGPKVRAACEAALDLGMPEARIPLGAIVCDMALSPKSNSAICAIDAALADIEKGNTGPLPPHLKNTYSFDGKVPAYKYPHDYPGAWVYQQYLPDKIKNASYYHPKDSSKYESALKERYDAINEMKAKYEKNK